MIYYVETRDCEILKHVEKERMYLGAIGGFLLSNHKSDF